ncbi:MAG: hypothetical protein HXY34_13940 [Candidatus Thorarchaeota archaeon]|nr:hypothetical protein [Candidatus Thorarchaeota archaeon]
MTENTETQYPSHEMHYASFKQSIKAGKAELSLAVILLVLYFYLRLENVSLDVVLLLGFIIGAWLAFRPSEWAVDGIESGAGHLRLTAYVAGMLSSLVSNMPEAVVSGFTAYAGYAQNNQVLRDISVLSVLISAGFNMLLLGMTIIVCTRKEKRMLVPDEVVKKDSVLIRWAFVALLAMFALGVLELIYQAPISEASPPRFPPLPSLVLMSSYIIYAISLTREKRGNDSEVAKPHHTRRTAAALAAVGFVGIFIAGEMLTYSVEIMLEEYPALAGSLGSEVTLPALLLGAAGALPEHGIALVAAARGKTGLAVGNLIGGVLQIVLLVMGGIGFFVPIPMDRYVLFQILVIAGSLWFLKANLTDDHELDAYEGVLIMLLQAYVFAILIGRGF